MIQFNNLNQEIPYQIFKGKYDEAVYAGQKFVEVISISSFNKRINQVESRYVNLKFIINNEFIFFSNYKSPKASSFYSHNQIAALIYWSSINVQIRIKANIKKTSNEFNQMLMLEIQHLKFDRLSLVEGVQIVAEMIWRLEWQCPY